MAQSTSNLLTPNPTVPGILASLNPQNKTSTPSLLGAGTTLGANGLTPASTALSNKINPLPLQQVMQPTALKNQTSSSPAPLTSTQLNQIAQGSGFQGSSFSSTGLPTTPQTTLPNTSSNQTQSNYVPSYTPANTGNNIDTSSNSSNVNPNANFNSNAGTSTGAGTPVTNPGIINQIQQGASQPSQEYLDAKAKADKFNQDYVTSKDNEAKALSLNAQNPIPLEFQQGRGQILQNQYLQQQGALMSGYQGASNLLGAANTQQGIQQSGLLGAAGLTQPVTQFGQLTNPQTGQVIGAGVGGNNPALDNAVANAVQMVKNGASPSDALSSLSGYGQAGVNAFNQAQQQVTNGTYNPTASNAIVQQNVNQGQSYQAQATQLSTTLSQFDTLAPQVTNFLNQSGINNSSSPWVNKAIKDYISSNMTPDNQATVNAMFGDLKTYTAQILGNSGLNPTEVSATVNAFDPSALSPVQLQNFLTNIKNLGQTRLAPLQQAATSSYGSNTGSTPYTGTSANTSGNYQYGTPNSGTDTAIGTSVGFLPALLGAGIGNEVWNSIKGFAGSIFTP